MIRDQTRQVTRILAIAIAVMAVVYLLLLFGLWRGAPSVGTADVEDVAPLSLSEASVSLPDMSAYADVAQRPLFSDDRKPVSKDAAADQGNPDPEPEPVPAAPLNVALTGIIHTPQFRAALLRDNTTGRDLSLQEQMPLPGEQGGWLVKSIEPRRVVFEDTANQAETAVELAIGSAPAAPPPSSPPRRGRQAAAAGAAPEGGRASAVADNQDEVARRAAEIRRRIEERRAQLRREAEAKQNQ